MMIILNALCLVISSQLLASLNGSLKLSFERIWGYTKYQIGGNCTINAQEADLNFPLSELEFPLDTNFAVLNAEVDFNRKIILQGSVRKSLTSDAGQLKDSDWGILYLKGKPGASQDSLDIYSLSDVALDSIMWDLSAGFRITDKNKFKVKLSAGFTYQYFEYIASNLDQWYPSYHDNFGYPDEKTKKEIAYKYQVYDFHIYDSRTAIKYDVSYYIPYITANFEYNPVEKLSISSDIGFSPYTMAKDYDNHVLRKRISKGDCSGFSVNTNITVKYSFTKYLFVESELDYMSIFTRGKQEQNEPGYTAEIDQEISSSQIGIRFISLGINF